MKPSEIARRLQVAPTTIRLWSREYADYLSPGGAGGDGRFRSFNEHDLRVLHFVQMQKRASVPPNEIRLALENMKVRDWDGLPFLPVQSDTSLVPVVPEEVMVQERRVLLRDIALLQSRVEQLESKLDTERSDKERLLREIAEMTGKLKEAELMNRLYEEGRIKPKGE